MKTVILKPIAVPQREEGLLEGLSFLLFKNTLLKKRVNFLSVGYFLFDVKLLKISATHSKVITPVSTGDTRYINPRGLIFSEPIIAINAVAPPGG